MDVLGSTTLQLIHLIFENVRVEFYSFYIVNSKWREPWPSPQTCKIETYLSTVIWDVPVTIATCFCSV